MPANQRNSLQTDLSAFSILQDISEFDSLSNFDCDDDDLNEFFRLDAYQHKQELLAETYALRLENHSDPVALISFSNDVIKLSKEDKERLLPPPRYRFSPAVKIGRLGVESKYQGMNVGTYLLNMTKQLFTTNNRTGCRFLTVDAYNKPRVIRFYKKNDFQFLHAKDKDKKTRIMYFDLKRFSCDETDPESADKTI